MKRRPQPEPTPPLPHSRECEMAALGAMMMLNDAPVTRGVLQLHPRHFYLPTNAAVFVAVAKLERRRKTVSGQTDSGSTLHSIDVIAVWEQLRADGRAESTGNPQGIPVAYLTACIEACPCAANMDYYIRVVIEKSRLRHLLALGERLREAAFANDAESAQLHAAAHNALQAINAHGWCDLDAIFEKGK